MASKSTNKKTVSPRGPPVTPTINIRPVPTELAICESNLHGLCPAKCDLHHWRLPYLWQINIPEMGGWQSLEDECENIERAYVQDDGIKFKMPVISPDGRALVTSVEINFLAMKALVKTEVMTGDGVLMEVRRLSTSSYVQELQSTGTSVHDSTPSRFYTQWRWFFYTSKWKEFTGQRNTPQQSVIESKFLSGQEVYRFEELIPEQTSSAANSKNLKNVFLIDFLRMELRCLNTNVRWKIRRRPQLITKDHVINGKPLPNPIFMPCPLVSTLPQTWYPIDPQQQAELVPLNPQSMAYHLVASEFHSTMNKTSKQIIDIYRIQNPLLWNQFSVKKTSMQMKRPASNLERQLFHGTSDEFIVEAICRDNFDWRVCGENVAFGKGSYFAKDALYSDRYSKPLQGKHSWMFMVRVLIGRYTKAEKSMVRPPALDKAFPHGERYDSCVDDPANPRIFVVFEKDQCYPEYLFSYKDCV